MALPDPIPTLTAIAHTSILGEAVHAGFSRLKQLLQEEFEFPPPLAAVQVARTLGFASWIELCECAISTTSRNIDPRFECMVEGHLEEDDLADRLAAAFGTSKARMRSVLLAFHRREHDVAAVS